MALTISQGFRDISFSFSRNPVTNDILTLRDENAIKISVINLIKTIVGERFFNDLLGSSVNDSLFELDSIDLHAVLKEQIQNVLDNFEPRVRLNDVLVDVPFDSNELNITVQYDIVGLPVPLQIVDFILQPTRI